MSLDEAYIRNNLKQYEQLGWTPEQVWEKFVYFVEKVKKKSKIPLEGDALIITTLNEMRDYVKLGPPKNVNFVFIGEYHNKTKTDKLVCNAGLAIIKDDGTINHYQVMTFWQSEATPIANLQPRNIYQGLMAVDEFGNYKFVGNNNLPQVKRVDAPLDVYLEQLGIDRITIKGCKDYEPKLTSSGKVIDEKIFCFEGRITEPKISKNEATCFFNIYDNTELRPLIGEMDNSGYVKRKGITCFISPKYKDMLNEKNIYAIIGTVQHKKEKDKPTETTFNGLDLICTFEEPEVGLEESEIL